jgi:alkylation response protein AidB-like acyl-CoA dehydrogenase
VFGNGPNALHHGLPASGGPNTLEAQPKGLRWMKAMDFSLTKEQRLYRDAKILEIYEGAKEIEKTIIARSLLN